MFSEFFIRMSSFSFGLQGQEQGTQGKATGFGGDMQQNMFGQQQATGQPLNNVQSTPQTSFFSQPQAVSYGTQTMNNIPSNIGSTSNTFFGSTQNNRPFDVAFQSNIAQPSMQSTGFNSSIAGGIPYGSYNQSGQQQGAGGVYNTNTINTTNTAGAVGSIPNTNSANSFNSFGQSLHTINPSLSVLGNQQENAQTIIEYIEKAYDKTSPFYKFIYTFYNIFDPNIMQRPFKPMHVPQEIWDQAERENPCPAILFPCIVFGYDELYQRIEQQKEVAENMKVSKRCLINRLNNLADNGAVNLAHRYASILHKYNGLIADVLERLSRLLGKNSSIISTTYEHLEKRFSVLSENINGLAENITVYQREFHKEKTKEVQKILQEQREILENIIERINKKQKVQ